MTSHIGCSLLNHESIARIDQRLYPGIDQKEAATRARGLSLWSFGPRDRRHEHDRRGEDGDRYPFDHDSIPKIVESADGSARHLIIHCDNTYI